MIFILNKMTTLTNDELFHLMLYSDIQTLTNICLSKNINYCHDSYFWKLKFGHDELPILTSILPTTLEGWRKEYIKVENAADKAFDILNQVKNGEIVLDYNDELMNFRKILPVKLRSSIYNFTPKYQSFNKIIIKYDLTNNIYYVYVRDTNIIITTDDLYDILTIIFYHYPNINIIKRNYTNF
jgi:hypothetical protein